MTTGHLTLAHGYNPNEFNWEYVVIGEPPNNPGRIIVAIANALETNGELIIFHATDDCGPIMAKWIKENLETVKKFTCFEIINSLTVEQIRERLKVRLVDLSNMGLVRPKNTWEEAVAMKQIIKEPCRITAVSSADHCPRVYRDLCRAFENWPEMLPNLSVRGSTLYGPKNAEERQKWKMGHVVILEIPGVRKNLDVIRSKNWTPEPLPEE